MAIIGISGKYNTGKTTVANLCRYLQHKHNVEAGTKGGINAGIHYNKEYFLKSNATAINWNINNFSDKVYRIGSELMGISFGKLQSRKFRESTFINIETGEVKNEAEILASEVTVCSLQEYEKRLTKKMTGGFIRLDVITLYEYELGRNKRGVYTWSNALLEDYKPKGVYIWNGGNYINKCLGCKKTFTGAKLQRICKECCDSQEIHYPNVFITDVRREEEMEAIVKKGGFVIRVERALEHRFPERWKEYVNWNSSEAKTTVDRSEDGFIYYTEYIKKDTAFLDGLRHPSEIELDNIKFPHTFTNNDSITALLKQIEAANLPILR